MSSRGQGFAYSSLLGGRAEHVYEWFLKSLHLPGDVAECGVYGGATSRELVRHLEENGLAKTVHMFDTFEGFPDAVTDEEKGLSTWAELGQGQYACPLDEVVRAMAPFTRYRIHRGMFADTFAAFDAPLCFIHSDGDLYQSTIDTIELADRLLVAGGCIVFDDYNNPRLPGVRLAVERFLNPRDYEIMPAQNTIQCYAVKKPAGAAPGGDAGGGVGAL